MSHLPRTMIHRTSSSIRSNALQDVSLFRLQNNMFDRSFAVLKISLTMLHVDFPEDNRISALRSEMK
jgi:hypothetical protein